MSASAFQQQHKQTVHEVGADSVPKLLYAEEYIPQRRVVSEDFHLAGAIKQHIVLFEQRQLLKPQMIYRSIELTS